MHQCNLDNCGKIYQSVKALNRHKKTHGSAMIYRCPVENCGKQFKAPSSIHYHKKTHCSDFQHTCTIDNCNKSFKTWETLRERSRITQVVSDLKFLLLFSHTLFIQHKTTHNTELNYICPVQTCQKGFKSLQILRFHKTVHSNERPFICSFHSCKQAFKSKSVLRKHEKLHDTSKMLRVHICGMVSYRFL